jgi:threonine dehydratase
MITIIIPLGKRPGAKMATMALPITLADVEAAAAAIRTGAGVGVTPMSPARTLSEITGAELFLKFENLQFTGSFKERGARNFLLHLSPAARAAGVVAASAGNHAQGVAYHAHLLEIPATIVMPADAPFTKVANTAHHGAHVVLEGEGYAGALAEAQRMAHDTGATLVPAFDDPLIIAGQGTVGLEMVAQRPDLDAIVVPVGGGGLIAGIAVAVKEQQPNIRVIGVQVDSYPGMLHALGRALAPAGGVTIAEGIAVTEPGAITRDIVRDLVDDLLIVSDQRIEETIALALEVEKTVLEGAGAAGLAAVLDQPELFRAKRVGVVLSGGNIDARVLTSVLLRALARSGRLVRLRIEVPDRPGILATIAQLIAAARGNIVDVQHRRDQPGVAVKRALLEVSIETRDRAHADEIVKRLEAEGFRVEVE